MNHTNGMYEAYTIDVCAGTGTFLKKMPGERAGKDWAQTKEKAAVLEGTAAFSQPKRPERCPRTAYLMTTFLVTTEPSASFVRTMLTPFTGDKTRMPSSI